VRLVLAAALVAVFIASPAASEVFTVHPFLPHFDFHTIQEAINATSEGDTVYVDAEFYRGPLNRDLDFQGKNLRLQGLVEGGWAPQIDCQSAGRAISLSAANDTTTVIQTFDFLNGSAVTGGAIDCGGGSPIIRDCLFRGNDASTGGAISVPAGPVRTGPPRILNCDFVSNRASALGGAAAISWPGAVVSDCSFYRNEAGQGGALYVDGADHVFWRSTFTRNTSPDGAAIRLDGVSGTIEQCVIAFNWEGQGVVGGAPETFHCYVYDNEGGDGLPGTSHDNRFEDPLLCNVADGVLSLCNNSPCRAGLNPWGLQVGSEVQGCADCATPVRRTTWGSLKTLFR